MADRTPIIEVHRQGVWTPAAELQWLGDERCRLDYLPEYVFSDAPEPIALGLPVEFAADAVDADGHVDRLPPPFLYDLVPQGKGRQFLVKLLDLKDDGGLVFPLLMAGAFNPIGRLRLDTAVAFVQAEVSKDKGPLLEDGLGLEDILQRSDEFLEHISLHSMLAAGTTGVQGVAPKFLLAQDEEGGWFADLALPDTRARAHWLLKLPRGKSDEDRAVLRNEAAYLRLVDRCGLRAIAGEHTAAGPGGVMLHKEMLFVRRFDREVRDGRLHRLHQESLASLAGVRGFGQVVSQNRMLAALRRHATDPAAETVEFFKRDVLNQAMRNTDNHARNTAMQRTVDGVIRLTPVFDFAPMFMDPEVVPRSAQWLGAREERLDDWGAVLDHLTGTGLLAATERDSLARELRDFAPTVARLPELAISCGVEDHVLSQCLRAIDRQAGQLAALA